VNAYPAGYDFEQRRTGGGLNRPTVIFTGWMDILPASSSRWAAGEYNPLLGAIDININVNRR